MDLSGHSQPVFFFPTGEQPLSSSSVVLSSVFSVQFVTSSPMPTTPKSTFHIERLLFIDKILHGSGSPDQVAAAHKHPETNLWEQYSYTKAIELDPPSWVLFLPTSAPFRRPRPPRLA